MPWCRARSLRARETAAAIGGAAGVEAEEDARLAPGATAEGVRALVAERGGTVVAVGHQPDCSEIVLELDGREVTFPPPASRWSSCDDRSGGHAVAGGA